MVILLFVNFTIRNYIFSIILDTISDGASERKHHTSKFSTTPRTNNTQTLKRIILFAYSFSRCLWYWHFVKDSMLKYS